MKALLKIWHVVSQYDENEPENRIPFWQGLIYGTAFIACLFGTSIVGFGAGF